MHFQCIVVEFHVKKVNQKHLAQSKYEAECLVRCGRIVNDEVRN